MIRNVKRFIPLACLLSALFIFIGCKEGSVGSEGDHLLKYLPEGELENFVDTAIEHTTDDCTALYDVDDVDFEFPIWIVDTRPKSQYDSGHIPYARSYPYENLFSTEWMDGIPLNAYLIVYSKTARQAALSLQALDKAGYTRWMNWGGIDKWQGDLYKETSGAKYLNKYLPAEALQTLVETSVDRPDDPYDALYDPADVDFEYPIWIVDTRPEAAYDRGHIPTAKSYPYSLTSPFDKTWYEGIPEEVYLILHCETGGRAEIARQSLISAGYTRVINWGSVYRWPGELVEE